ncbi:hypothetical protein [Actinoplanes sp. NPDC026619]|uniref:hypothetical protein n=1 Tax=Actinoplanes sp. NPDC026619 TaxID=3155798 RepID=UPI0033D2A058
MAEGCQTVRSAPRACYDLLLKLADAALLGQQLGQPLGGVLVADVGMLLQAAIAWLSKASAVSESAALRSVRRRSGRS